MIVANTVLLPGQWEMNGFLFGKDTDVVVSTFEFGPPDIETGDSPSPRVDVENYGRDYLGGRTIAWGGHALSHTQGSENQINEVLDLTERMNHAWIDPKLRRVDDIAILRWNEHGRVRRAYGRPRKFAYDTSLDWRGRMALDFEFRSMTPYFYGDQEYSITSDISPPIGGGFTWPIIFPWSTIAVSNSFGEIQVIGKLPAHMIYIIRGPIAAPKITVQGQYVIEIDCVLRTGEWLALDSRPWSMGARLNGIADISGKISSRSAYLNEMSLSEGTYNVVLSGQDASGTASLTTAWRPTYASY